MSMSLNATIEILERSIIDANATRYLSGQSSRSNPSQRVWNFESVVSNWTGHVVL